jgi:hypothetical protein
MATYFVRTDGNDGNTGLGAGTGQAWSTIGKALGATGITGGDTVNIAPGTYREVVTIGGTYSSNTFIYGNPTASLFSGVLAGEVRITPSGSDNAVSTSYALTATSKNNLNFKDLIVGGMNATTCTNLTIEKCLFFSTSATTSAFMFTASTNSNFNTVIKQSVFTGTVNGIQYNYRNFSAAQNVGFALSDSVLTGENAILFTDQGTGYGAFLLSGTNIFNCVLMGSTPFKTVQTHTSASGVNNVYNSLIYSTGLYAFQSNPSVGITENYNRVYGVNTRQNVSQGANTTVASWSGLEFGQSLLQGFGPIQIFGNTFNSPNATAGTASGAPAVDMYGQSWNVTPDVGVAIYRTIGGVGAYQPASQASGTITIAPGSTSQSVELFLGATGLTSSTTGLSAYYNRTRTASVAISLVARTIAQAWTSGGFAEVDATNMPGVYRLDLPDAALAAGASDVTIVVRGASGTNGAVLTVTLSSGGLTAAQTAAAVWDEPYTSHVTASTFGARTLKTTVDNRPADVGTSFHIHANVHAIVDSAAAASELSGALLHNGTDYISAELLTPVSAATSVHIGPYQLLADGLGADQPLDVNVGTATSIDVQVTDANGTGIDITGATVTAKVYSSAGTLVASYAGTATYADNGRLSFGLTTTVTNTSGTYTVTVTRTTGATDTQIFGPLRLYVRPV